MSEKTLNMPNPKEFVIGEKYFIDNIMEADQYEFYGWAYAKDCELRLIFKTGYTQENYAKFACPKWTLYKSSYSGEFPALRYDLTEQTVEEIIKKLTVGSKYEFTQKIEDAKYNYD